ncbi:hypothetical protein KL925_003995 [Ogataea polymorpha]|uniref:D-arabinitol 2-dehydrogenase [ribulose-forming] n=2 Tax=Ogataea polymorpha TaxID=460523 RepID=A0A9P8SZB2_9ASCO|nr:hypothetical protein KL937_003336 [Ogataea polymorpha]KAG7887788.1 hypothetical protein KL936_003806 [Ogataea polymorpha]KAG7891985.1 hypothetical protein KL908_003590 [Ogataea polymorpha]KAG7899242.1 hypothetical protein KL935_003552 [Ogataea polymorpha]KAG7907765.1 hypothetical protein KL906_003846 [Ogataea polymorpha]
MADIVPTFRLDNELTVVTGASGGLSNAILKGLLAYGSEIALLDMNLERTKETQAELFKFCVEELKIKEDLVPKMHSYVCDISDAEHVNEVFAQIYADFGKYPLHLVNTAGYCENFPAEHYPAKNAEKLLKVNLLGALYVAQAFAKPLIDNNIKGGSIVMIGSMSGEIVNDPQPQVAYNMSKAGVIHMVKSLAAEWAKYSIRVNTLSPGYILTPLTKNVINGNNEMYQRWLSLTPMGRLSEAKEFTGTVLYLLSNSASSYTTGANITVDGGFTCW